MCFEQRLTIFVDTDKSDVIDFAFLDSGVAVGSVAAVSLDVSSPPSTPSIASHDVVVVHRSPMRADHPVVKRRRRGAANSALDKVHTEGMGKLIDDLRADRYAVSVRDNRAHA